MSRSLLFALALMVPGMAAADRALLIGSPDGGGLFGGGAPELAEALEGAGFTVVGASPASAALMRGGLEEFLQGVAGERRLVIHLAGQFARSGSDTWLLSDSAGKVNLASVAGEGLALSTVLEIAAGVPGQAIVLIGTKGAPDGLGTGLQPGIGALEVPQGVTVITGASSDIGAFATGPMLKRGESLEALVKAGSRLSAEGYLSGATVWRPAGEEPASAVVGPLPGAEEAERAVWQAAEAEDSVTSYLGYLERYPLGSFAEEARQVIAEIEAEPYRSERKAEEALGLSRDDRRQIQRNLTLLNYAPKGIDGIFGPGTRGAIKRFQGKAGFPETSYLTPQQITRLTEQAERRSAELEAEAERRRLEQERLDRDYWDATGAQGDEAGLRVYLKKYPDGLYSEIAQDQLAVIADEKRREAQAQDRTAWDRAVNANSVAAFRNYLVAYPEGAFAEEAQARIETLTQAESPDRKEAEARETALGLTQLTRVLVERRLAQLGLEPGPTDGRFEASTRRAIRRFQRDRELGVTGYLDEATVARMLADAGLPTLDRSNASPPDGRPDPAKPPAGD
ncbi:peptidoglycan-binding domain-containing protein [Vannielia sp.]|uniref:peptidoglycan-binding domain-containing protein n=1 Tax=Vannielia sp. TaxID=2813045 RepID=UPI002638DABA|nr:peptidoglycan-binding domain-containing protein [Vannielia sp.]MDF1873542.1 peptidoglycan-binding domain-containing protein [Vannielia sp.]